MCMSAVDAAVDASCSHVLQAVDCLSRLAARPSCQQLRVGGHAACITFAEVHTTSQCQVEVQTSPMQDSVAQAACGSNAGQPTTHTYNMPGTVPTSLLMTSGTHADAS